MDDVATRSTDLVAATPERIAKTTREIASRAANGTKESARFEFGGARINIEREPDGEMAAFFSNGGSMVLIKDAGVARALGSALIAFADGLQVTETAGS